MASESGSEGYVGPSDNYSLVSYAEEMNPSRRNTMEDAHRIIPAFDNDPTMSFFAVYDGHGGSSVGSGVRFGACRLGCDMPLSSGRGVVEFLETRLEKNLAEELRAHEGGSISDDITRAYLMTDTQSKEADLVTSGATAVTCLIKRNGSQVDLYAANVGDSRAVLCQEGKAVRLTYDHKADDESEKKRVEDAGGFILRGRVLGILAVSRAFGDHGMKEFVTASPHTTETSFAANQEVPFLILACDGLWDVFSDQEAVRLVAEAIRRKEMKTAANTLVQEALKRGSTDNITVVVVFF